MLKQVMVVMGGEEGGGGSVFREMCLMHVSFCVSSGGRRRIMHVPSDLSTHSFS